MLAASSSQAQTLSLDEAIALGLANNRSVANPRCRWTRPTTTSRTPRSYRLPSFKVEMQGSQLLKPIDVAFDRGVFGDVPGIGPIPATDTIIRTPARLNFLLTAEAQQPLTHLIKVNLKVHLSEAAKEYQREVLRDARLGLLDDSASSKRCACSCAPSASGRTRRARTCGCA